MHGCIPAAYEVFDTHEISAQTRENRFLAVKSFNKHEYIFLFDAD